MALETLAAMPFLDYLELAAVSGMAESTARQVLGRLRRKGLADFLRHASPLTPSTRRWFATIQGMRLLASETGTGIDRLLRAHPVSAHWQRILLARLDTVAVVYRLASAVADAVGPPRFRWYRAAPLDAAMTLADGRTVGAVRQGATADRTAFSDRVRRLLDPEQSRPRALLALMPDEARLRQARRLLARYPGPAYLCLERDAARLLADERVWHGTSAPGLLSLSEIFARLRQGGAVPWERPTSRQSLPDDDLRRIDGDAADHLLPVLLKPAEKRMLDCLADWPLITAADLGGILGLSPSGVSKTFVRLGELDLVSFVVIDGLRRLALSDGGLALLARRDRASVGTAVRRWSVEPVVEQPPSSWRDLPGARVRPLARTIDHTHAVHRFMAALVRQAKETRDYRVVQTSPPHHAVRYFRYGGTTRSVHPDAFGIVRTGSRTIPFFLEYERRAVNPSTMIARLAPYLRYYSSNRPLEDHGHRPLVLIVFDDPLAEANFLGVARREVQRSGVELPLWVSHREAMESVGPLGKAWRNPDVLEPGRAFV